MDRIRFRHWQSVVILVSLTVPLAGCGLLAHSLYVIKGNKVKPIYDKLHHQRVAIICMTTSPAAGPNSPSGMIAREVSTILAKNVEKIELVRQSEIADWIDRNHWNELDYLELGRGVNADRVIALDLESFRLREGKTLFKGRSTVTTTVYDLTAGDKIAYQATAHDFMFPQNGARHTAETTEASFRRMYVRALGRHLAKAFYAYDLKEDFAYDATSIRR
ncbi:MAG TPA: hypothetical protein EYN03_05385 [Planctomycetes bacterium]|nr:hypothetical protein [Planctomycetota bacterium]